jgi:hypothetical protein
VRMIQRRNRTGLLLKPFVLVALELLDGNHAVEHRVSRAFQTSPIPPAPMGARISYGPKRVPAVKAMGC